MIVDRRYEEKLSRAALARIFTRFRIGFIRNNMLSQRYSPDMDAVEAYGTRSSVIAGVERLAYAGVGMSRRLVSKPRRGKVVTDQKKGVFAHVCPGAGNIRVFLHCLSDCL